MEAKAGRQSRARTQATGTTEGTDEETESACNGGDRGRQSERTSERGRDLEGAKRRGVGVGRSPWGSTGGPMRQAVGQLSLIYRSV